MPGLKQTGCSNVPVWAGLRLCGLLIALQFTGCQVSNTWFQMDSNSPMPFFGFDIALPRRTAMRMESLEHPGAQASRSSRSFSETPVQAIPVKLRRSIRKNEAGDVVQVSFE